jgi:hypothetical protein
VGKSERIFKGRLWLKNGYFVDDDDHDDNATYSNMFSRKDIIWESQSDIRIIAFIKVTNGKLSY